MLSVQLDQGKIDVENKPMPRVPKGSARIQLLTGGICATDLELQRGYYGFSGAPGHEFVGEVVAVNGSDEDKAAWMNRRVVGDINLACGKCDWCKRGLGRHCPTRTVLGIVRHPGAFQQYFTLPLENLHRVPQTLSTDRAVFTEPTAAACEILEQVKIPKGTPVAVLGDGKLGLLITQVLATHGAKVHLYGRHKHKMKLVEPAGATWELSKDKDKMPVAEWPLVVDSTGSSQGLETAVAMCQPRGTVVMKSTVARKVTIDTAPIIVNEITMVGSRCGLFPPAIRLLNSGMVQTDGMIDSEFPLADAPAAFERAATKGVLKVLLRPPV